MANKPTEYTVQYLENLGADVSVSPPVLRRGLIGKALDGSYYDVRSNSDGELKVVSGGHVSTDNSSVTPLIADDVFTGVEADSLDTSTIVITVYSDVASATNGLVLQIQLYGSTTWRTLDSYSVPANDVVTYTFQPAGNKFRVMYTNGGTGQTTFELETLIKHNNIKPSSHKIQDTLSDENDGELGISVVKLRTAQNDYVSMSSTITGNAKISVEEYNGNIKSSGLPTRGAFQTNDIEEASATVTYIGMESEDGTWWIKKIDTSSGNSFQHASATTDPVQTTYTLAWTNRATLSYTDFGGAF